MGDVWLQPLEVGFSSLVFLLGDIDISEDEEGPFKKLHWFWCDLPSAFRSKYYAENGDLSLPSSLLFVTWTDLILDCLGLQHWSVFLNTVVLEPSFASYHRLYKNWNCLDCITQKFWFSRSKMRPEVLFFPKAPKFYFPVYHSWSSATT